MPIENGKYVITKAQRDADIRRAELSLAISNAIALAVKMETGEYGHITCNDILCVLAAMTAERARRIST